MCGILGFVGNKKSISAEDSVRVIRDLFLLSESRGREASGFAGHYGSEIRYLKTPFPAGELVRSAVFDREMKSLFNSKNANITLIGHSRLVTNGYEHDNINNQPVVKNNFVAVHNGIIVNCDAIWKKYADETQISQLDSEVIPTLLSRFTREGNSTLEAVKKLYDEIYGMTTIALLNSETEDLILATNNGSLYYTYDNSQNVFVFASERYILNQLCEKKYGIRFSKENIKHLEPQSLLAVHENLNAFEFSFSSPGESYHSPKRKASVAITEIKENISNKPIPRNTSLEYTFKQVPGAFSDVIKNRAGRIAHLKRCTKCILPETFPFIKFDENGVCNYCNHYKPITLKGKDAFVELAREYKSGNAQHDCLLPFSGGRDSSYALHYVKKELGLNPIAFSYDWGMLTDLARRNQARMCGALGVEHILISADIRKKRENIRKNVSAWLKRPDLGTIPLFMAGDKQYFYFANLLMEQNNLKLSIMGENMLETTRFKSGFCGIKPNFNTEHTYTLSTADKMKMILYYGKEYLLNPAYINSSLLDTFDAFKSYYVIKHRNVNLFDYIPWIESEVESVLINEYDWETDPGTRTTWRIGDGTAAFYNYIYYVVAGFSENDTFRSNQIREGLITREEALRKTNAENQPRWDSIQWYCNTIGIDWERAIKIINGIKTLYP
jgi:asparagine synthetase B (glutamine-hydrolysing)